MTRAENKEQYKEYDNTYYMKHRRPKTKIGQAEQRIADLESKLAEKDKIIEIQHNGIGYWKSMAEKRPDFDYVAKIKDLEQQLAEKEKENKKLKQVVDGIDKLKHFNLDMKDYVLINIDVVDELYCENQDKISFAVERLEKVKERMKKGYHYGMYNQNLIEYIDTQIKQLKEMK